MKASTIESILKNNPVITDKQAVGQDSAPVPAVPAPIITLRRQSEYDSLHPVDELRKISAFFADVRSRYEENQRLIEQYQKEQSDLWHFAELHDNLDGPAGYRFYKATRESCRKRRDCKNEMELLEPVIQFMDKYQDALNQLPQVQGKCGSAKKMMDMREYTLRTDVIK